MNRENDETAPVASEDGSTPDSPIDLPISRSPVADRPAATKSFRPEIRRASEPVCCGSGCANCPF